MELVEPESAVVDEGGLAWALPCQAKWHGEIDHCRGEHWWDQVGVVYASDVCQFRNEWCAPRVGFRLATKGISYTSLRLAYQKPLLVHTSVEMFDR